MTTESGDEEIQILVGTEDPVVVCKTATGLGMKSSEALEEQNPLGLLQLRYSLTENKQEKMSLTVVLVLVASYINTKSGEELGNSTHFIPIHTLSVSVVAVFSYSLAASAFTCVYPHVAKWFEAAADFSVALAFFASLAGCYISCVPAALPLMLRSSLYLIGRLGGGKHSDDSGVANERCN